jgi:uncharacterized Tic20 family protein
MDSLKEQLLNPSQMNTRWRKLLRVICHAAALTSSSFFVIGAPIVVLILSEDPLVKDSAKEAINYSITVLMIACGLLLLCFTLIGIPFAMLGYLILAIVSTILPLIAIVTVCLDPNKPFRYPCILRLIKSSPVAGS